MKCTSLLKPVKVKSYCRKATATSKKVKKVKNVSKKAKPLPPIPTKAQQKKARAAKAKLYSIAKRYLPAIDKESALEKRIRIAERKVKVAGFRAQEAEMKQQVGAIVRAHKNNPNDPRIPRLQAGLVTLARK